MVLVLDDFLPNFEEYKQRVLQAEFSDVDSQGMTYNDISLQIPAQEIYDQITKKTNIKPVEALSFLRAYRDRPDYRHPMWIHSDVLFSDYIGILMIKPSEFPQDDGVALWKNKELNDIQLYTKDHTGEKNKIVDSQSLDPEKWEMWKRIEFKENRLLICPASYFHSKATYGNYGKTLVDCRIVHVLFFNQEEI